MKITWSKLTSDPDPVWSGEREGTRYWIQCDPVTHRWSVMDSHGAVWGDFDNHEQAMREVEEMK